MEIPLVIRSCLLTGRHFLLDRECPKFEMPRGNKGGYEKGKGEPDWETSIVVNAVYSRDTTEHFEAPSTS